MTRPPLYLRLYFQRPLFETASLIGYAGIEPFAFWDQAKKLGIPTQQLQNAVYGLTRADRREASPPRYELREDVKQLCWLPAGTNRRPTSACSGRGPLRCAFPSALPFRVAGHAAEARGR